MNEADIQDRLHRYFSGRLYQIPNIYLYDWESDFLSVTRSGYIYEYEIKVSKEDFKRDTKVKTGKHEVMKHGCRSLNKHEQFWIDSARNGGYQTNLLKNLNEDNKVVGKRPNYFWYVCPPDVINDVPEYAGIIHCCPYLEIIKKAPLLHKEKITPHMEKKILASFYFRYWNLRLKNLKTNN